MLQDDLKKSVGWAALSYIEKNSIIGVGTGSTVKYFIEALSTIKNKVGAVVSSSEDTSKKLRSLGIKIIDLNDVNEVMVYIDGADEINSDMQMIKGGGAALTREKIIAAVSKRFICIADDSKQVKKLGNVPLPIEVIPIARNYIIRELYKIGGFAKYRSNVITDNGNIIIDVYNLNIVHPINLEKMINSLPGVVTVGLFAIRGADIALIGTKEGVRTIKN